MINIKGAPLGAFDQISSDKKTTIKWDHPNAALVALTRRGAQNTACLIFMDYWSEGYSVVGDLPEGLLISKGASSKTFTIEYTSASLRAMVVTVIANGVRIEKEPV